MTERSSPSDNPGFDELHRAWKNTRAPARLAAKIMASVEEPPLRSRVRGLALSGAVAVILIGVVISMVGRHPVEPESPVISLPSPSLAAINQAAGGKPSFSIPGFGNVKSIPQPPGIPPSLRHEIPAPTSSIHEEYDDEISNQTWIA